MPNDRDDTLRTALAQAASRPRQRVDVAAIAAGASRRRQRRWIAATTAFWLVAAGMALAVVQLRDGPSGVVVDQPDVPPVVTSPSPTVTDEASPTAVAVSPSEDGTPSPTTEPSPSMRASPSPAPEPTPSPEPEPEARFTISTRVELIDETTGTPFTVDVTSPGVVTAGEPAQHEVGFTGTDGTLYLDDPRFTAELQDGEGRLRTGGRGCKPSNGLCTDDYAPIEVRDGERTVSAIELDTSELAPGTYVLDQPVAWDREQFEMNDPDGRVTVRITYTVEEAPPG